MNNNSKTKTRFKPFQDFCSIVFQLVVRFFNYEAYDHPELKGITKYSVSKIAKRYFNRYTVAWIDTS